MNYLQQNLKKLLNDHKMTQKTLAEKAGISLDTVKKIFRTNIEYTPNAITLDSIAGVFGIKADMLLVPNLEQLEQDIKDSAESNMDTKKYDVPTQFRIAMIEGGFDEIVALVDYLQFMGYVFAFMTDDTETEPSENDIKTAKNDLSKLKKDYHKRIAAHKKALENCTDDDERNEYELEILNLEDNLKKLDESIAEGRKVNKSMSLSETIAQRKLDVDEIVRFFNSLAVMTKSEREKELKHSGITVEYEDCTSSNVQVISIYDFYKKCEAISNFIRQQF